MVRRLKNGPEKLDAHDNIMKKQLSAGIIEKVSITPEGKEFYILHKLVVRGNTESTKMRIVYVALARSNSQTDQTLKVYESIISKLDQL